MAERSTTQFKNLHAGQDIYVLGSAASLDYFQPDLFDGRIVIGCNFVFRTIPCNYSVWKEASADNVIEATKAGCKVIVAQHPFGNVGLNKTTYPTVRTDYWTFPHKMNGHTHVNWSVLGTDQIVVSYSTITSAMHLAAYMGARTIFMAGIDGGALDGRLQCKGYPGADEPESQHAKWYRTWIPEILPQTLELRDRLLQVYDCKCCLLSPFLNFQLEGHRFEP